MRAVETTPAASLNVGTGEELSSGLVWPVSRLGVQCVGEKAARKARVSGLILSWHRQNIAVAFWGKLE